MVRIEKIEKKLHQLMLEKEAELARVKEQQKDQTILFDQKSNSMVAGLKNKPPSKSVLKILKSGPKNIKNQRFFELFLPKIQIFVPALIYSAAC